MLICKRCKEKVRHGSYYVEAADGEVVCGRHLSPAEIEAARRAGTLGETAALPQTEAERDQMLRSWGLLTEEHDRKWEPGF